MDAIIRRPRILSGFEAPLTTVVGTDPSVTAWVNAVVTNGGTVSTGRQTLVNTLITTLKNNGNFSQLDRLWITAAENQPSALTDMVALQLATAVNSPTFTVDRGYQSIASTSYVDTLYIPNNGPVLTQNSAHDGIWIADNLDTSNATRPSGTIDASNHWLVLETDVTVFGFGVNEVGVNGQFVGSIVTGHWIGNRVVSTGTAGYLNGAASGTASITSTAPPTTKIFLGCLNNNGTPIGFNTSRIAAWHAGSGLSATDATNIYNALRTYMTAVGVP